MTKYLLIDCGYFNFFRYFAAKNWYKLAHTFIDDESMQVDPIFVGTLIKRVDETILKLLKDHGINRENIVFCRDCRSSDIWRRSILPEYKGTREQKVNVKVGFCTITDRIEELCETWGCKMFKHERAEADDLVYLYRRYILEEVDNEAEFVVVTSDIDYYQLCEPNTQLTRLDKRDIMSKSLGDPKKDLLLKIIMGDKSDNIPSIVKKCGPKKALSLTSDEEALKKLLEENSEAASQFKKNSLLVDFSNIPEEIREEAFAMFKI